jgi:hypothetical protein
MRLPNLSDLEGAEWRIHYHVPVFAERITPAAERQA